MHVWEFGDFESGRTAGRLSSREARRCDDAVRPGCAFGAGRWCDPRRLDHGQQFVAMVFYIKVPLGLLAFGACYALLRDPEYLIKERLE